ncbi:LOW QUALITY PROTEIN: uncharacterized protein LOC122614401 [Drosophila teissieri]|uniref:LOW QUALITY PROTEIN: uncharacterized protein LOC122614401 n=1 Tax=Drosophila teissieri TaxID=7243 RepID=UPI001CBA2D11|nr:LOW QUALITY PROTEIN: uncharacterized protein LOC122614401 [Drosophila teissieri]
MQINARDGIQMNKAPGQNRILMLSPTTPVSCRRCVVINMANIPIRSIHTSAHQLRYKEPHSHIVSAFMKMQSTGTGSWSGSGSGSGKTPAETIKMHAKRQTTKPGNTSCRNMANMKPKPKTVTKTAAKITSHATHSNAYCRQPKHAAKKRERAKFACIFTNFRSEKSV